jgi:hypothetical protein
MMFVILFLPLCQAAARARRRSKRSILLPRTTSRAMPVYAGWQAEQTSTTSSDRVERVVNSFPQVVQWTVVAYSSG